MWTENRLSTHVRVDDSAKNFGLIVDDFFALRPGQKGKGIVFGRFAADLECERFEMNVQKESRKFYGAEHDVSCYMENPRHEDDIESVRNQAMSYLRMQTGFGHCGWSRRMLLDTLLVNTSRFTSEAGRCLEQNVVEATGLYTCDSMY